MYGVPITSIDLTCIELQSVLDAHSLINDMIPFSMSTNHLQKSLIQIQDRRFAKLCAR